MVSHVRYLLELANGGTRYHASIHRRYVAHVFYAFNNRGIDHTFLKGRYLNQELVDKRVPSLKLTWWE